MTGKPTESKVKKSSSKIFLVLTILALCSWAKASDLNNEPVPQCVATDIGLAFGLVSTSGEGPVLPIQTSAISGQIIVQARLGTGTYYVSNQGREVVIAAGDIQSVGFGTTRILDVKNGIGLKCSLAP
jgi:hypothetical protein